ncbi:uncharacterized protein K452DRAFT_290636 [Aplosporella prunicola CBS 121167]|uniref:gamma-glutamylcyclotransferase n=1 Tax=Aplosporella prunicola CBS 121167 TaxID=1176127 RepID=A0A6A6B2Q2_9PEZI|nr:uncharacterized protein K452DRAFT_290636 [Aplosporella prunicola CBS 121167]KAF2138492.1 hypothetical protein K452DRAFT_290636 [Aplosporella prunicola CBS 121167]
MGSQQSVPATQATTIYFGYGSNLWLSQMRSRCPTSSYLGIGRLEGYRWQINERHYANIVETQSADDVVYGLVYDLPPADEALLDRYENVPHAYTKENMSVDFWLEGGGVRETDDRAVLGNDPEAKQMLVYISRTNVTDSDPYKEYIGRMNNGIKDAVSLGVPQEYFDEVLRKFIPAEEQVEFTVETKRSKRTLRDAQDGSPSPYRHLAPLMDTRP